MCQLIIHPHQIQPIRRRDRAAGAAVARLQRGFHVFRRPLAFAHQLQSAGEGTDLVWLVFSTNSLLGGRGTITPVAKQ